MMEIESKFEQNTLKKHPYGCSFCNETFPTEEIQMNHILNYFKTKSCEYCDQIMIQIGTRWFSQHNEKHEINETETILLPSEFLEHKTNEQQPEIEEITIVDENHFSDNESGNDLPYFEIDAEDEAEIRLNTVKKSHRNESGDYLDSKRKKLTAKTEYFCTICKEIFNNKESTHEHVHNYHKKPRKSIQKYVKMVDKNKKIMKNSQSEVPIVKHKCSICEIFKPSMTSILKHFESFHKDIKNVEEYIKSVEHEHAKRSFIEISKINIQSAKSNDVRPTSSKLETVNAEPVIKHQCLICEIVKPSKSSILKHFQSFHSDVIDIESSIKCLRDTIELIDLVTPSTSEKPSTSKPNESTHLPAERKPKKKFLVCNLCEAQMKTIDEMMRHVKSTHQIEVIMPHSEKRSQSSRVFCNICKHLSNTKFENLIHVHKCHESNNDIFKDIKWASIFKRDNNRYECLPCGKNYIVGDEYCHHLKQHHPIEFEKLDAVKLKLIKICDRCGRPYLFNRKESGKCCFQAKDSAFRIMCEVCGQLVIKGNIFNDHMNTHNGIQPYQCSYCSKTFSTSKDLHKHDYSHRAKEKSKNNTVTKGFIEHIDDNYE